MKQFKYIFVYQVPLVVFISIISESYWSFFALVYIFLFLPIIELFTQGSTKNLSEDEESKALSNHFFDWVLWSLVPIHFAIGFVYLYYMANSDGGLTYKIGATIAYGISCGVLGINAAHELGHRQTWYEQLMSKALLMTTLYMHFFIEHNRGHHTHVSTDDDPASAKYGETVYAFYFRSIWGSWWSAWQLEKKRLSIAKISFWHLQNEMIVFQIIQLSMLGLIFWFFGLNVFILYVMAAVVGIILLETVNYIEHYGLRRQKKGTRYERTMPHHSWNSNHPIGRLVLLELSRHSDHHFLANRKYQILRHFDESPQMPTGYPGMMMLSLIPPLWFKVMHGRIKSLNRAC
jgi:alkane 1-monooxygenase